MASILEIELPCGDLDRVRDVRLSTISTGDSDMSVLIKFTARDFENEIQHEIELAFTRVYEFRWGSWDYFSPYLGRNLYKYGLVEIEDSPYLEPAKERDSILPHIMASRWAEGSKRRARHYGLLMGDHGAYGIVASHVEVKLLNKGPLQYDLP